MENTPIFEQFISLYLDIQSVNPSDFEGYGWKHFDRHLSCECSRKLAWIQTRLTSIIQAGAFAAFTVDLLVYPLDTLKTRWQSPDYNRLYVDQVTKAVNKQVLFRGLYQGVGSVIIATLPSCIQPPVPSTQTTSDLVQQEPFSPPTKA